MRGEELELLKQVFGIPVTAAAAQAAPTPSYPALLLHFICQRLPQKIQVLVRAARAGVADVFLLVPRAWVVPTHAELRVRAG